MQNSRMNKRTLAIEVWVNPSCFCKCLQMLLFLSLLFQGIFHHFLNKKKEDNSYLTLTIFFNKPEQFFFSKLSHSST